MAHGDYIEVTYLAGGSAIKERVIATSIGGTVDMEEPRERDLYVVISELSKSRSKKRTFRFAKSAVLAITNGHDSPNNVDVTTSGEKRRRSVKAIKA